jgi:hypothetical protein
MENYFEITETEANSAITLSAEGKKEQEIAFEEIIQNQ